MRDALRMSSLVCVGVIGSRSNSESVDISVAELSSTADDESDSLWTYFF